MKLVFASSVVALLCGATVSAQIVPAARGVTSAAPRSPEPATPAPGASTNPGELSSPGTPSPDPGTAADPLSRVQALYASAAYEDALAAMPAPGSGASRDLEQYRALCLLAIGRQNEASAAVERVVLLDPLFVPSGSDTPPRLQAMYGEARVRLAPGLAKAAYADAKGAWERKDRTSAHAAFQRTLDAIAIVPDAAAAGLGDLRELASGFLQLTAATPGAPSTVASPGPAVGSGTLAAGTSPAAGRGVATAEGGDWQGPVAIRQDMPGWQPPDPSARRLEYRGRIRLTIDPAGRVEEVKVLKPSHPAYDAAISRAARLWAFTPASRGGRPVSSEKEIEVHLRPE